MRAQIKQQLLELRQHTDVDFELPLLVRFAVPASSLLDWLAAKETTPNFYFQSRSQKWEIAGVGRYQANQSASISLEQWYQLQKIHPKAKHLRLFFCRNFSSNENWSEFSLLQNLLPLCYRERTGDDYYETHLIPFSPQQDLKTIEEKVSRVLLESEAVAVPSTQTKTLPTLRQRIDTPNYAGWERDVGQVLATIKDQSVEKVVLARRTDFKVSENISTTNVLKSLQTIQQDVFHYAYSPEPTKAFIGASPERLFQVKDGLVKTEALAGTVGHLADENIESLYSKKNMHEHNCVVTGIKSRLNTIATQVVADAKAKPLCLADMTHLKTKLTAKLASTIRVDKILSALHPTAAVCGEPQNTAAKIIEEIENFSRGLYAGPIGILRGEDAECAVALRCCLVQGERISFYTGAGIVAGSNAAAEWRELETKIATLYKLFS